MSQKIDNDGNETVTGFKYPQILELKSKKPHTNGVVADALQFVSKSIE